MNILLFTDNLNSYSENETYSLEDYLVRDREYFLFFKNNGEEILLCAQEDENQKIKNLRLTLSKADEDGNIITTSDAKASLFREKASLILRAYTYFEKDACDRIISQIVPASATEFSKTGELKILQDEYTLIFYSNKIGCQLIISNNYIEEVLSTEKPVSKPLYGETAVADTNS